MAAAIAGLLALIVFYHGPGKAPNRALAALLLTGGVHLFGYAMFAITAAQGNTVRSTTWLQFGNAVGGFTVLLGIPLALSWPEHRDWAPRGLGAVWPYATVGIFFSFVYASLSLDIYSKVGPVSPAGAVAAGISIIIGLALGAAYLLVREARSEVRPELRDGRILIALGISLPLFNTLSRNAILFPVHLSSGEGGLLVGSVGSILLVPLVVAFFLSLWTIRGSRAAQIGIILAAASLLSGAFDAAVGWAAIGAYFASQDVYGLRTLQYAFWRLVPVALLAYVVLRGQVPGLDVKVRWGISRSTIAAAFVAAFFVASEGAQILFGSEDPWVGLLAAGLLVFAIAPLQRAAERLAVKAVPIDAPPRRVESAEWLYRVALEAAMGDGPPTREDERRLAKLAHDLGLSSMEALAVRHALEDEPHGRGEGA